MFLMEKKSSRKMSPEEKAFHASFGERVKNQKEKVGLTSEKLAEMAGISYQWVSSIENARTKRGVSLYVAYKLSRALRVPIENLIGAELLIDEDTAFELMKKARERKNVQSA